MSFLLSKYLEEEDWESLVYLNQDNMRPEQKAIMRHVWENGSATAHTLLQRHGRKVALEYIRLCQVHLKRLQEDSMCKYLAECDIKDLSTQ